ncbi:RNA-binding protein 26-like [Tubulanus polymorphus]|uniref:RNA-binding protein 26-like n=1 Tax=Tubulanus polymorphus TaxID=672921 RepID=UPI003DA565C9
MLIDNFDALKSWLTNTLTPICDADPVALAKYVVALVKKDKPESELNDLCMDQLDVFLQDKTKEFVAKLFEAIKNKAYLEAPPAPAVPAAEPLQPSDAANKQEIAVKPTDEKDENIVKEAVITKEEADRRRPRSRSRSPVRGPIRSPLRVRDVRGRFDRDDRGPPPRRRFDDRGPPPRRFEYDRERYRYGGGGRYDENFRRGPPPPQRPFERARSHSPRGPPRSRSRSRERRTRSRTPRSLSRSRSRSFSRSRSVSRSRSRSRSRGGVGQRTPDSRGSTPIQDREPMRTEPGYRSVQTDRRPPPNNNNIRSARPRCRDFDEKGFCMRGDLCPFDHGLDPVVVEDVALPSVITIPPGGGPARPMPPGAPPPGMAPRLVAPGAPPHRPMPPHTEPYQPEPYNPEAPLLQGSRPPPPQGAPGIGLVRFPAIMPRVPGPPQPLPPGTRPAMAFGGIPQGIPPPPVGPRRDLVNVPTVPHNQGHGHGHGHGVPQDEDLRDRRQVIAAKPPYDPSNNNQKQHQQHMNRRQPGFDFNRLGYKRHMVTAANATLEVRKIPRELNNISKLNEHFSKFGTITNLQVCYENDPEGALVTFANHNQANFAYRSAEPLFNNRFIKVFWHKEKDKQEENGNNTNDDNSKHKEKPTIPPPEKMQLNNTLKNEGNKMSNEKVIVHASSSGALTKTVVNAAALKSKAAAISANESVSVKVNPAVAIKRKKEEAIRAKLEIQKKKQELLQKHLQEQKLLIEKLEKNKNITPEEKASVMKTIKVLAEGIENLKKDLLVSKSPAERDHKIPRTRQEAQKEILDTELELITKPPGPDTVALRAKVEELKKEAASLGLLSSRGRGRGGRLARGSFRGGRGRGRGGIGLGRSLDHRPKQLKVVGFTPEEKDEVTTHFAMFGQLQNTEFDETTTSAIFTFTSRKEAEQASVAAGKFKDKQLVMSWYKPSSESTPVAPSTAMIVDRLNSTDALEAELAAATAGDEAELEPMDDVDEDLLLGDLGDEEEEDDEDEDRSWRR